MNNIFKWIQALSQIVTTVTAVVTAVVAYETLIRTPTQEQVKMSVQSIPELVTFNTSNQTTTLRATKSGLKCYLLDKKTGNETLQWTITPVDAQKIIENRDIVVQSYNLSTGKVSIGAKKNWWYSKRLHPDPEIFKDEIIDLLKQIPAP